MKPEITFLNSDLTHLTGDSIHVFQQKRNRHEILDLGPNINPSTKMQTKFRLLDNAVGTQYNTKSQM